MKFPGLGATILLLAAMNAAVSIVFPSAAAALAQDRYTIYSYMPSFENRYETDHFVLKWTNKSRFSSDNISDPRIIKDTAGYLEYAWAKYTALFGRHPYTPPGRNKIEVVFYDIDSYGTAYPPDGPIQFNSGAWVKESGIRQPTSAHELFHKMQYAYGYTTRWTPQSSPYLWFTEGTAAWAEVFVWGRVSRTDKLDKLFRDTGLDLYAADFTAAPFWIYFVQGNRKDPNHHLMVEFFEKCERFQDEKLALNEVIKETYGSVDGFFRAFARDRKNGFWSNAADIPYNRILGPDGKDIVQEVKDIQRKGKRG